MVRKTFCKAPIRRPCGNASQLAFYGVLGVDYHTSGGGGRRVSVGQGPVCTKGGMRLYKAVYEGEYKGDSS